MLTDDLIADLAANPVATGKPTLRIAMAMLAGWLLALMALVIVVGPPLAALPQTGMLPFGVKTGFALAFLAASVSATIAAGRPGKTLSLRLSLIAVPFVALLALMMLEMSSTPRENWSGLFFGTTYMPCIRGNHAGKRTGTGCNPLGDAMGDGADPARAGGSACRA